MKVKDLINYLCEPEIEVRLIDRVTLKTIYTTQAKYCFRDSEFKQYNEFEVDFFSIDLWDCHLRLNIFCKTSSEKL